MFITRIREDGLITEVGVQLLCMLLDRCTATFLLTKKKLRNVTPEEFDMDDEHTYYPLEELLIRNRKRVSAVTRVIRNILTLNTSTPPGRIVIARVLKSQVNTKPPTRGERKVGLHEVDIVRRFDTIVLAKQWLDKRDKNVVRYGTLLDDGNIVVGKTLRKFKNTFLNL